MLIRIHTSIVTFAALMSSTVCFATADYDFQATTGCESIEGYDPSYAEYGNQHGQQLVAGKDYDFIHGFYQMAERDGKLYAVFGGAIKFEAGIPLSVRNATPGMLVVLNSESMQFEKSIALPFHAHALALVPDGKTAIATHSRVNAFSIIDLSTGEVHCKKPDTTHGGIEYKGRYVVADDHGFFYISYYSGWDLPVTSVVMKYDFNGNHADGYEINVVEPNLSMALFYEDGKIFSGGKGVKVIDAETGKVSPMTSINDDLKFYNYTRGPANTLLATNFNHVGQQNIYLIDLFNNTKSAIYTGSGALEISYLQESEQLIANNHYSSTVTIASLPGSSAAFIPGNYVNIKFNNQINTLFAKSGNQGGEIFVTEKQSSNEDSKKSGVIHKISISESVKGINGIREKGSCSYVTFTMSDKKTSKPTPCAIMDPEETHESEIPVLEWHANWLENALTHHLKERDDLLSDKNNIDRAAVKMEIDRQGEIIRNVNRLAHKVHTSIEMLKQR